MKDFPDQCGQGGYYQESWGKPNSIRDDGDTRFHMKRRGEVLSDGPETMRRAGTGITRIALRAKAVNEWIGSRGITPENSCGITD
jgi:hypothetical protein